MKILRVFDNIKLSMKMGLIGLLTIVGLAMPTFHFTQLSLSNQESSEKELQGLQPISMVVMLKKMIAEHRGLSATYLSGDTSLKGQTKTKVQQVDVQLQDITNIVQQRVGNSPINAKVNDISNQWSNIKNTMLSNEVDAGNLFLAHSLLIIESDLLIESMANYFLLSYDPAAASYHAIIANFKNLPKVADALGKVRGAGASSLASAEITLSAQAALNSHLNSITSPLQYFEQSIQGAAKADPRFQEIYRDVVDLKAKIEQLNSLSEREILNTQLPNYSSNTYFNQYSNVIDELYSSYEKSLVLLNTIIEERIDTYASDLAATLSIIIAVLLISAFICVLIVRSLNNASNKLINAFDEISQNNFDIEFNTERKDEMGILEAELSKMNVKLQEAAVVAIEASKVKQALDNSSTCFMMSNAQRIIVYMNDAMNNLLKTREAEIRKTLPQFNADKLIGTCIDSLHHDSVQQHKMLDQLSTPHQIQLELGDHSFKLNINPIIDENANDLGNTLEWFDMTEIFEEERKVVRILEALDSASTNIMISDADRNIIYLNRSVKVMLQDVESDLRKVLPHFEAATTLGKNMDIFHKDPSHQKQLLGSLSDKFVSEITVGARNFRLTANPITSKNDERIGTVVEWLDRTKEIKAEREVAEIVEGSAAGDFTKRINESDKSGFMLTLAQGLNQLTSTTETGLNEVSKVLLALSEGDLTKEINNDYKGTFNDLKNYCNTTSSNLANMISKIREASDTINNASTEIAQGNSDLSTRTEQQASSLEETASSMEELTSTVRLNAENANQANTLASQAVQVAGNGGNLIQQVVKTMASINDSSNKISDIIGVIDGIAFQTNILALNAAVEAARAGEQGRGFAVVASEVRTLAQRSANAAKDIKDLISDSVSKVESGNVLVNQSGETMKDIVTSIQGVNDIMSEIAAASAEQSSGIDEVSKAITQMDEMTQQNAALVEEAAAAAESMRTQACDLHERMGSFKVDENQAPAQMNQSRFAPDKLSQQFDELPSVSTKPAAQSNKRAMPAISQEDEWESF